MLTQRLGFKPGSSHVGFVVGKVALGQVFSEYFGFPANLHSTNFSTITLTYHPGLVQQTSSGCSTESRTPLIKKKHAVEAEGL
jgi:hypothetical protein